MKKDLKSDPICLRPQEGFEDVWMYEEGGGLDIYMDSKSGGASMSYVARIPLATIRAYLRRLDKKAP